MLIVERVIAPPDEGRDAKFSDLNMLVGPGGRERTREDFVALLEHAALQLERALDAGSYSVLEAVAADTSGFRQRAPTAASDRSDNASSAVRMFNTPGDPT